MNPSAVSILSPRIGRRVLRAAAATAFFLPTLWCTALYSATDAGHRLQCEGYQVSLSSNGGLMKFEGPGIDWAVKSLSDRAGTVQYWTNWLSLEKPAAVHSDRENECSFVYQLPTQPPLKVTLHYQLRRGQGTSILLNRQATIESDQRLTDSLTVRLPLWRPLGDDAWLPRDNGTRATFANHPAAAFRLAGKLSSDGLGIALPLVSQSATELGGRITYATDPQFSTLFTREHVEWTYPKEVGLEGNREQRRVTTILHPGGEEETLQAFFQEVLDDVPPGPPWLHEIAMVDFDFMSDGGRGWFADIDALAKGIAQEDRSKVLLCMHGWYDWLGRYSFDLKKGRFDESWTAFGNHPRVKDPAKTITIGGQKVDAGFAKCVPVQLTLRDLHKRLAYAKSRGFRVGMYFADGMVAGSELPDFSPRRVLAMGGWQGPDTPGQAYCQNPLAPEVRQFYLAYAEGLLAEFGGEVDAFVWDETFSVPAGSLGSKEVPGYADRAMMRLVRDVAQKVERHNHQNQRQLALLTSDCLGTVPGSAPYALAGHGTFQDTWCQPKAWSYAIFPNYRNTVWSCCWWPVTKWQWIDFGVRHYQAPVAVSNGWGDNIGFAEMSAEMQKKVLDLFQGRKQQPAKLRSFNQLPAFQ